MLTENSRSTAISRLLTARRLHHCLKNNETCSSTSSPGSFPVRWWSLPLEFVYTQVGNDRVLAKFERDIEAGKLAQSEKPLLDYALAHPNDAKTLELVGRLRLKQEGSTKLALYRECSRSILIHFSKSKLRDRIAVNRTIQVISAPERNRSFGDQGPDHTTKPRSGPGARRKLSTGPVGSRGIAGRGIEHRCLGDPGNMLRTAWQGRRA